MGAARRSVLAAVGVSTAAALPVFLIGALAVQIRADLGFSRASLGLAPTVFFGVGAATSAVAGRFVERVGPRFGMRLAVSLAGASMLGIASVAGSWNTVLVFLAVAGVANAVAQPGANLLLSRSIHAGRQGTAFGIKQSAIPASMLLGGLAVPTVALTVGWRWAFAAGAALATTVASSVPLTGEAPPEAAPARLSREGLGRLLTLALGAGLGAATANTLGTFLVESTVDGGVGEAAAGLLFALGSAVGLSVRLGVGVLADRRPRRDALGAVALMLCGGAAGYALLASGAVTMLVPAVVLAFGLGWGWPGLFNYSIVNLHRAAPAAATGITQTGVYLGAVAGPATFGFVADRASFEVAWTASMIASLVAALGVAAGRRVGVRAAKSDPARFADGLR